MKEPAGIEQSAVATKLFYSLAGRLRAGIMIITVTAKSKVRGCFLQSSLFQYFRRPSLEGSLATILFASNVRLCSRVSSTYLRLSACRPCSNRIFHPHCVRHIAILRKQPFHDFTRVSNEPFVMRLSQQKHSPDLQLQSHTTQSLRQLSNPQRHVRKLPLREEPRPSCMVVHGPNRLVCSSIEVVFVDV